MCLCETYVMCICEQYDRTTLYVVFAVGLVLIEQATSPEASVNDKSVANR